MHTQACQTQCMGIYKLYISKIKVSCWNFLRQNYRVSPLVVSRDHWSKKIAPLATAFAWPTWWEHLGLLWAKMLPWSAGMLCKRMEMDQNGWSSKSEFILSHPLTIGQATLLASFRQSIHRRLNWVACSPKLVWGENLQEPSTQSILNYIMVKFNIPCFLYFFRWIHGFLAIAGGCWWISSLTVPSSSIYELWEDQYK